MPLSFYWWGTLYFTLGCFLLQSLQFNWDHLGVLTSKHTYCCCNGNSHTTCSTRPPQQVTIQQEWLPLCQYREWLTKCLSGGLRYGAPCKHPAWPWIYGPDQHVISEWYQLYSVNIKSGALITDYLNKVLTSSSVNVASSNHIMLQFPRNTVSGLWGCFMRGRSVFLFPQMQQAWYVIIIYIL